MKYRLALAAAVIIIIIGSAIIFAKDDTQEPVIRVAFLPSISHAIPIVGLETGIFTDLIGNETHIDVRVLDSGTQAVQSLISGNLDIAYVGPGPAVNAFVRSDEKNIVILEGAASGGVSFIVQKDSNITNSTHLVNARIAVPQIANTQDVSLRTYLAENNILTTEHGGNTSIISVAGPELYTLFSRGSIDAAWVPEPWASLLVESLGAIRLFHEKDLWPDSRFSSVVLVAHTDYIDSHPDTLMSWIDGHKMVAKWIRENPQPTQDAYTAFAKQHTVAHLPPDILAESFENVEITTDKLESSIEIFAQRASDLGYLGREEISTSGIFYEYEARE